MTVRSPVILVLIALLLGLALGLVLPASPVIGWITPLGTMWINALRMTVVPLLVSLLVTAVAGGARTAGRLGVRALALFAVLAAVTATATALVVPHLWGSLDLAPEATAALRASSGTLPAGGLSISDWLVALVPANAVKAAAEGQILPLLLFTLVFAAALARLPAAVAAPLVGFFDAVGRAMLIVVGWVLALAPIGVFALAAGLGAQLGGGAAAALALYFGWIALGNLLLCAALLPLVRLAGMPVLHFARAIAPAQAVGFAARSSFAALPAMIAVAHGPLGIPPKVADFVLPLAAATFKIQAAISVPLAASFIAALYGVPFGAPQIALAAGYGVLMALTTPGVTGAGLLMQIPLYEALGLPVGGLALLLAVDTLPDMFKTLSNVTADLVATVLVAHGDGAQLVAAHGEDAVPSPTHHEDSAPINEQDTCERAPSPV